VSDQDNKYESLPPYNPMLDLRYFNSPLNAQWDDSLNLICRAFHNAQVQMKLPVVWSIDNDKIVLKDLTTFYSLLVVGTSYSGKTNFLHQLLISLLFKKHPSQLKIILIDFKGLEFAKYRLLERHYLAKLPGLEESVLNNSQDGLHTLMALSKEIDNRVELFKDASVKTIIEYNDKFVNRKLHPSRGHQYLPYLLLVIDELADLMITSRREMLAALERLLTDGYRVGIISIICTNQFIGDNFPNILNSLTGQKAVFRMFDKEDYRKFLHTTRIDKSITEGEFIYKDENKILYGKSTLISSNEIDKFVDFIVTQTGYPQAFLLPNYLNEEETPVENFDFADRDSLFEDAARLIVQNQIGSTSLLQRRMKLGYNRTERLMDQLEAAGIVGPNQGSKVRDVLIKTESELEKHLNNLK